MKKNRFWGALLVMIFVSVNPFISAGMDQRPLNPRGCVAYIFILAVIIILDCAVFLNYDQNHRIFQENEIKEPHLAKCLCWAFHISVAAIIIVFVCISDRLLL